MLFRHAPLALSLACFACGFASAQQAPALQFGHDPALPLPKSLVFSVAPNRIIADAEAWKAIGADGFFLEGVASEWSSDIWATDGKPFTIGASDETFQNVKRANEACAKLGMVNFLKVVFANPLEWFNDTAWQQIDHNFRQFAIFARDTGCKGVALDIEYIGQQYVFDWPGYDYKGYTRQDLINKVRERATRAVAGMYEEFPDMEFLVLPEGGFGLGGHIETAWVEEAARRDAPGGVHFCMEATYTMPHTLRVFAYAGAVNRLIQGQLSPAAQQYWQARCTLAAGMWPTGWDYMPNHDDTQTPAELRESWAGSLMVSPKYNWIYVDRFGENHLGRNLDAYKGKTDFAMVGEILRKKEIATDPGHLWIAQQVRSLALRDVSKETGVTAVPRFMVPQGIPSLELTTAMLSPQEVDRAWKLAMDYYNGTDNDLAAEFRPVRDWQIIGPFQSGEGLQGHNTVFPPEASIDLNAVYDGANGKVKWMRYYLPDDALGIDFKDIYTPGEQVTAYAVTYVDSPVEQTVQLRFGSNDSGKVWVGGTLVNDFPRESWCIVDRDIVTVTLPQGRTPVLAKATTGVGAWGLTLRFTDTDGKPLNNLKCVDDPARNPPPTAEAKLDYNDLVFIRMNVDKQIVTEGEPVTLSMQLWRIQNRRVTSGPYRGSLMVTPTTEGFTVKDLEPTQFEANHGSWTYDVSEDRKLLYPNRTGTLTIGKWHWEGIALINRTSVVERDRVNYKLDVDPIEITVNPKP